MVGDLRMGLEALLDKAHLGGDVGARGELLPRFMLKFGAWTGRMAAGLCDDMLEIRPRLAHLAGRMIGERGGVSFKELGEFGRLGNQLFQIAAAVSLALEHGDRYLFPPWKYAAVFGLRDCFSTRLWSRTEWREPHFHFAPIPYRSRLNLSGYFQSEKYFAAHSPEIRRLFTNKAHNADFADTCSIHVRRTDYLILSQYHAVLPVAYYAAAIRTIVARERATRFMVFSDDIEWCRSVFVGDRFLFSVDNPDYVDLALMARCRHHIIANSSFSWWGAWLGEHQGTTVICPDRGGYFGPANAHHDLRDLYPEAWLELPASSYVHAGGAVWLH